MQVRSRKTITALRRGLRFVDSNSAGSATLLGTLPSSGCSPTPYVERPPLAAWTEKGTPHRTCLGVPAPSLRTTEPSSRPPRLRPVGTPPSLTLATTDTEGGPSVPSCRRPPALPTFAQADIAVHVAAAGQAEAQRLVGRLEAAIAKHPAGHVARVRRCRRDAQSTRRPREAATGLLGAGPRAATPRLRRRERAALRLRTRARAAPATAFGKVRPLRRAGAPRVLAREEDRARTLGAPGSVAAAPGDSAGQRAAVQARGQVPGQRRGCRDGGCGVR